jgi:5-methylcytosine-specific restriction protein A
MDNRFNRPPFLDHQPRAVAESERRRNSTNARKLYQTKAWATLRGLVLFERPHCSTVGCRKRATVVDHIVPHDGDAERFFSLTNLQPLCKQCHDRKTAKHDGGFGRERSAPRAKDEDDGLFVV